jgi:hypothetical protein
VRLGEFDVHNIPAKILPTRRFSAITGKSIDGVIGTVLLYHFPFHAGLPCRAIGAGAARWRAGRGSSRRHHGAVLDGRGSLHAGAGTVNGDDKSHLWFVDTGLAGSGFLPTKATMDNSASSSMRRMPAKGSAAAGECP